MTAFKSFKLHHRKASAKIGIYLGLSIVCFGFYVTGIYLERRSPLEPCTPYLLAAAILFIFPVIYYSYQSGSTLTCLVGPNGKTEIVMTKRKEEILRLRSPFKTKTIRLKFLDPGRKGEKHIHEAFIVFLDWESKPVLALSQRIGVKDEFLKLFVEGSTEDVQLENVYVCRKLEEVFQLVWQK